MNGDKSAKTVLRNQKQTKAHQQLSSQKKIKDFRNCQSSSFSRDLQCDTGKNTGMRGKQTRKGSSSATVEDQKSPRAQRKLSDASNASEDLSKDSGCQSGKLSSSDSSSEMSDCPSEGNKNDSPSSDNELSWIDGGAYVSPGSGRKSDGTPRAGTDNCALQPDTTDVGLALFSSSGEFVDLMMGETSDDLVREVEDLRSENEYLKDEVEELRCEMLEMRDMFQEEEVYQLQELRLQLEQANKTCRILHYRLRKAERRSIRVAQTGQVDGELVRSLEHDIKVAKSVSLRLYSELEAVQKKNSQLEWENEALREKTQELEVANQVLRAEVEKSRESTLKKKSIRSTSSKTEKRLSQQIEDDSADLRCQLHFAREELALMCKKLTKLVSESEAMREELAKYHSAYGDIDATKLPEGKQSHARAREAEVKVHLKLVEEEATLLSRRIVELEVENRGQRAEISDLRDKMGRCRGEEEEEEGETSTAVKDTGGEKGCAQNERAQGEENDKENVGTSLICNQSACQITREGPVGGERAAWESPEGENKALRGLSGLSAKENKALLALRDHSCILSSAIQLLVTPSKNGHCSSPPAFTRPTEANLKVQKVIPPLNEALELLQAMLLAFIRRVEMLLMDEDSDKLHSNVGNLCGFSGNDSALSTERNTPSSRECAEDLRTTEVKEREILTRQTASLEQEFIHSCRDPKMHLMLRILWILHQWCQVNGPKLEEGQDKEQTMSVLRGLLQDLGAELQDEPTEIKSKPKVAPGKAAECVVSTSDGRQCNAESSKGKKSYRQFSPHGCMRKNWIYISQEAAQLEQEDPVKTWDHLIMPLSFPDLDFERMSLERSHTAPEKSAVRIYFSPPSTRRVQLMQSTVADRESVNTTPPWCTPPTSFSQLCLGSSSNLSDDMKEMTAGWKQMISVQEKRGQLQWVGVASSGTQTHIRPPMVSVGLQTDAPQGPIGVKGSPSRSLSTSLASARSHHISTSVEGIPGRVDRSRTSTSSPKLYQRHSAISSSSPHLSTDLTSSSSRDRALWNLTTQSHAGLTWTRQTSHRAGSSSPLSSTKSPGKSAATNRYGMVTEFLRRVSGRVEKPTPASGQKVKSGLRNLERIPARPPTAPLHRNDSVTRIVNQRFMKQRDEASRAQKDEKESNSSARNSPSNSTAEDANYDCSSSSTLTFCFARSSRSTQRQTLNQSKRQLRHSPVVSRAADSQSCD